MDNSADTISHDGEVMQMPLSSSTADQSLAVAMSRIEIDHQISTARAYPRSIDRAIKNITTLTTLDEETAESCIYALPRSNKPIQGPSIRLAEVVAGQWGNNRNGARIVHVDRAEKVVVAEGLFHDLETNVQTRAQVQRRIVDSKGRLYSDDMIIVTGNAACSIAKRNAILGGVPRGIWGGAYDRALKVVAGTAETLAVTREKAVGAFAHFGVKPEQVFGALALEGYEDITLNHIPTLRGMFSALKNGEATVEEMFSPRVVGNVHQTVTNPLADSGPAPKASPAAPAPKPASAQEAAPGLSPDATIAELERRLSAARTAAEVEKAFSDVTVGNKLYKATGYMDRARALKAQYAAGLAAAPKKSPQTESAPATSPRQEADAAGTSQSIPQPNDVPAAPFDDGINPDDEIASLDDKLGFAKTVEDVEGWYVETDIEAALGDFSGYVEKAREVKARHVARFARETSAPPAPAAEEVSDDVPPPPADEAPADDMSTPEAYEALVQAKLASLSTLADYEALRTGWWNDTRPTRHALGVDHAAIGRMQGYFGARKDQLEVKG